MLRTLLHPGVLVSLSYALLAIGILQKVGLYTPLAYGCVVASFVFLCLASIKSPKKSHDFSALRWVIVLLIATLLYMGTTQPIAHAIAQPWFRTVVELIQYALIPVVVIVFGLLGRQESIRSTTFILMALVLLWVQVMVPIVSPSPQIDVFTMSQDSADHLLEGKNPYTTAVTEVYQGRMKDVPAYVYLPSVLYLQTFGKMLFGDIRFALVIAQIGFIFFLWKMYKDRLDRSLLELVLLLFLVHPRNIFVIEQAWTDMFILCFFAMSLWLRHQGKNGSAAAAYGYMLSLKQYLLFFVFHWLMIEKRWKNLLLGIIVAAITVVPFALWNLDSFIENGVMYNLNLPFRSDLLIFSTPFWDQWAFVPTGMWTLWVGAVAAVLTFILFRKRAMPLGYLQAVTITTFALFFFGGRATINYYYFVGGLMVVLLADVLAQTQDTES